MLSNKERIIDLTLPLYDHMPVGNVWAWDVPFQTEPIVSIERNGFELFMITMHSEAGTRLMIPAMQDMNAPKVDELDLKQLVLRNAVVVTIPKEAEEEIQPDEVEEAFNKVELQHGDAAIVRTGWGDNERYLKIGDDYARNTPHWSVGAAQVACRILKENGSNLVLSDVAYYGRGEKYVLPEWASKPEWERPPFPSQQARSYLRQYTREKAEEDWDSPPVFNREGVMFIGACCNCGAISKPRVKVIILPLKIKGAAGSTCTVVAIEE